MRHLLFSLLVSLSMFVFGQDSLSLLFIGDVMQHGSQIKSAYNSTTKKYEYDSCFKYLKEEMSDADITIANLEFTLGGKPYKGYPMFSAPDEAALALKKNGVDILVTANNHTCDRRKKGVIRTLDVLDDFNIKHTGSFRNKAEKELTYPMLIEKKGFRLALLNYTYGTNGLPIDPPTKVNLLKKEQVVIDIAKAKAMNVDQIIVYVHWGSEYEHAPNDFQKFYEKLFFKNGVDIVIGSHPHVLQPMIKELKDSKERLIAYSLGNFISNQRTAPRDGGAMLKLELVKNEDKVEIVSAGYMLTWVWVPTEENRRRFYVLPASKYEMDKQMIDTWSHTKMKAFIKTSRGLLNEKNKNIKEYTFEIGKGWSLK